ncbi:S16 family serine protease [Variovorax humicola]|uniref:S16 family serine protease n=1 Tax=Variovorax humicola TaxID=1769758 RepID=A0ABU8W9K0_9BURK
MVSNVTGVATGLAWTPAGGEILFIEATRVSGMGKLNLTGQLENAMKESAQAALTLIKARAALVGVPSKIRGHRHPPSHPAGAIPKDGPSAGVALFNSFGVAVHGQAHAPRCRHDRRDQPCAARCCPSAASRKRCWRRSARVCTPFCCRRAT